MKCLLAVMLALCSMGCSTSRTYTKSDFVYYEFEDGKKQYGRVTIRGDGLVDYHFQHTIPSKLFLAQSDADRLFQSLVDAGLFDLPQSAVYAYSGPPRPRIEAKIGNRRVDFDENRDTKIPEDIHNQFLPILRKVDPDHW